MSSTRTLGDVQITAAAIYVATDWVTITGVLAFTYQVRFIMGSGGSTARAFLQTSIDQGATAIDISCDLFTNAGSALAKNFSGLTPRTTALSPSDGALSDNTAVDGIIGELFRMKIVTTGTYAGQTMVSGRINYR